MFKYPLCSDGDPNFDNVPVFRATSKGTFHDTGSLCRVPILLTRKTGFAGVIQTDNPDIVFEACHERGKIKRSDHFLCLKCNMLHSGNYGNVKRHLLTEKHRHRVESFLPEETIQIIEAWCLKHHIAFIALADPLLKTLIPDLPSLPIIREQVNSTLTLIKSCIKQKIQNAMFITASSDAWSSTTGRKLGVALFLAYPNGDTETRVIALREADGSKIGSEEISSI